MQTKILLIIVLFVGGTCFLYPQSTLRERLEQRQREAQQQSAGTAQQQSDGTTPLLAPGKDMRGGLQYGNTVENIENAKWSRIIYRYLDLTKEANAPLYYPVTPVNGKMSLFTMLFRLLQEDAIPAYEFLDGREEFTEEFRVGFQELLDRFGIYYESNGGIIVVNDVDIPGNEVEGYYVKEVYYFDTSNSDFRVRPLAICPVLNRQDDYGATTRYPLFWIPYEEIAPYARRIPIMNSSLNNSMGGSVDDFFRLRKYDGEIYKAQNPRNLAITQYTSTPEEMKAEQERIEQELANFEKNLWKQEAPAESQQPQVGRRERNRSSAKPTGTSSVSMRDRKY